MIGVLWGLRLRPPNPIAGALLQGIRSAGPPAAARAVLGQLGQRPAQEAAHCRFAATQLVRDLGVAEPLDAREQDHLAAVLGEALEPLLDPLQLLARDRLGARRAEGAIAL